MNLVLLKGNIGSDAEVKNGAVKFSVATTERWLDKESGEKKDKTEWHRLTAFKKEKLAPYLKKGTEVLVTASLRYSTYETESGEKKFSTDLIVQDLEFCGKKPTSTNNESDGLD